MKRKIAFMAAGLAAALCLAGTGLSAAQAADSAEYSLPVRFLPAKGLDVTDDGVRLAYEYRQDGDRAVFMEAERSGMLRLAPGRGAVKADAGASGGFYLTDVNEMEFYFTISKPGRYTAWYRGNFPKVGHWNHTDKMDNGQTNMITDSEGQVLNTWVWTKGPGYDLKAGRHVWSFAPYAWCGGAGLDKVALCPEGYTPDGVGEKTATLASAASGEAVSEDLTPTGITAWKSLSLQNVSGAGDTEVRCSADGGKTWLPLAAGGDLQAFAAAKSLRFKLAVAADKNGMTPLLQGVSARYQQADLPEIVLENDSVKLAFSGVNGALRKISNKITKQDYIVSGRESPLFSFLSLRGEYGQLREIGFNLASLREVKGPKDGRLELVYSLMGGSITAGVTVLLEKNGLVRLSLEVLNNSVYKIAEVKFPDLKGLRIGDDEKDDYLFTPVVTGSIVKYPAALEVPRQVYNYAPLCYPGMASMCWMDLWDEKNGGLYIACEDKSYRVTEFLFSSGDAQAKRGKLTESLPMAEQGDYRYLAEPGKYINLGFQKRQLIERSNKPVKLPDVVLGIHNGDWHWGADRYREWAYSWMRKNDPSAWLKDMEGISDFGVFHIEGCAFAELTKGFNSEWRKTTLDKPVFPFVPAWSQHADSEGPWSTPVLHRLYGTEEQFTDALRKQHEMGHAMTAYVLPPAVNPAFNSDSRRIGWIPMRLFPKDEVPSKGFYEEVGRRNYDGSLSKPAAYSEAGTCMGAAGWREYLKHIVLDKYIKSYGTDGMYLDSIGLVTYDCADLSHGHGYGEWTSGMVSWLREIKEETRKIRPNAIYFGEGMSDVEHQYLDAGLIYIDNAPQVYRYTFPENIGIMMGAEWWRAKGPYKEYPMDGGCFEIAAVFGLKFARIENSEWLPEEFDRTLKFRQKISQFQNRSRFMDEKGLEFDDKDLRGKLFLRDEPGNRGVMAVFFNAKRQKGITARMEAGVIGEVRSAWYYTDDGPALHKLQLKRENGRYVFSVPAGRLSAVLLLRESEPFIDVERPEPVVRGEPGRIRVTVRNLEAAAVSGKVRLDLPSGWKSGTVDFKVDSGESAGLDIPFQVPAAAKFDVYQISARTVEKSRQAVRTALLGVCRPLQAELYYQEADVLRLEIRNSAAKEVAGKARLDVPEGIGVIGNDLSFKLAPHTQGALQFRLTGTAGVQTRQYLKAVLNYEGLESVAHEIVQPCLLNGNFEQDSVGDGYPDYWTRQAPREGSVLDKTVFTEGKQSLRLNAYANGSNSISNTLIRLIPGKRYRLSCSIRRSAQGDIGLHFYALYVQKQDGRIAGTTDIWLGGKPTGPAGTWERFETEFTATELSVPYDAILFNNSKGAAVAWFDDIRLEEIKAAGR